MNTSVQNTTQTAGYNLLMAVVRQDDWYDPKGAAYGWMGSLADVMLVVFDDILPGYRPSPLIGYGDRDRISDDSPTSEILPLVDSGQVTMEDIGAVFMLLSRFDDIFKVGDRY